MGTVKFWRCDKRSLYGCKARLHARADTDEVVKEINEHNHDSDAAGVVANSIRIALKRRAEETMEAPANIINDVCLGAPAAVAGELPSSAALRAMIRRRRSEVEAAPPLPASAATMDIPPRYQTYGDGERFLLYDSGLGDEERILIFGRQSAGGWASRMKNTFLDGTFKTAPPQFAQVYVVVAERGGFAFPVLYGLLPNKRERSYRRMFAAIRAVWPEFSPERMTMDFELAAITAARAIFPAAEVCGCFFHLTRSLKRAIAQHGLLAAYNRDPGFALSARMIAALAFVPLGSLEHAVRILADLLPSQLRQVLTWFEEIYIGPWESPGIRGNPTFPPEVWTVYQRTLDGLHRTNNFVEAAHRRMRASFGCDHPTIWRFIDGIRRLQAGRDVEYEHFIRGDQPSGSRSRYMVASTRIAQLAQSFDAAMIGEYLRAIAHNFRMH